MLPLLVSLGALALTHGATTNRPIIGVLANGPNCSSINPPYKVHDAYIAASYVKWVEAAGARVVPIPWFIDPAALDRLMPLLNGFVFPGGGVHFFSGSALSPYGRVTKQIFDHVVTSFAAGESVPLWGTCLGHEMIMTHGANQDPTIDQAGYSTENVSLPLNFTAAAWSSRLWGTASADIINTLATTPSTINLHDFGISPSRFNASVPLSSRFSILSTNLDLNGREFVSSTEGRMGLPIFTTQFHPEKIQFEWWASEQLDHNEDAMIANAWTARVLVHAARNNGRSFANIDDEARALIYNWSPLYTGNPGAFRTRLFLRAGFSVYTLLNGLSTVRSPLSTPPPPQAPRPPTPLSPARCLATCKRTSLMLDRTHRLCERVVQKRGVKTAITTIETRGAYNHTHAHRSKRTSATTTTTSTFLRYTPAFQFCICFLKLGSFATLTFTQTAQGRTHTNHTLPLLLPVCAPLYRGWIPGQAPSTTLALGGLGAAPAAICWNNLS